jgi:hypothetical protein
MASPTQNAEIAFQTSYSRAILAASEAAQVPGHEGYAINNLCTSINALAQGLGQLAIGLRATYALLDRVEKKLDQQKHFVR